MMAPMARASPRSAVFSAIAEPQRREILVLLRAGERPVTELAQELRMTQPGASKHLRGLREVGLGRDRKAGKQRLYGLGARALRPVHEWTGGVGGVVERACAPAGGRVAAARMAGGECGGEPDAFESVLTFAPDGAATGIEMRTVFPSKELRDEAVEKYHAIEGGQQTLSNLAAYVTEIVRTGVED